MPVKPIPEGYHTVTPLLSVKGGGAIDRLYEEGVRGHGGI